jgi:hypothetical protein
MRRGLSLRLHQLRAACFANLRLKLVAVVLALMAYIVVHHWAERRPPVGAPPPTAPPPCN